MLQQQVDLLAFPNGRAEDYTDTTLGLTREAGYRYALTTRAGLATPDTPPLEIRRVLLGPETDIREVLLEMARALKRGVQRRGREARRGGATGSGTAGGRIA
jgi:hypothetical protein